MAEIKNIKSINICELKPYKKNAKIHGKKQVEKIAKSILEFGFLSPCLVDRDLNIIAGHGRVMAAEKIGMAAVPCVFIEGLSEAQKKAYILADNRLGELADWDMDAVMEELEELQELDFEIDLTGFELKNEEGVREDDYEINLQETPKAARGEVYILGRHRVMCGDATNVEDVRKLVGGAGRPLYHRSTI